MNNAYTYEQFVKDYLPNYERRLNDARLYYGEVHSFELEPDADFNEIFAKSHFHEAFSEAMKAQRWNCAFEYKSEELDTHFSQHIYDYILDAAIPKPKKKDDLKIIIDGKIHQYVKVPTSENTCKICSLRRRCVYGYEAPRLCMIFGLSGNGGHFEVTTKNE